MNSNPNWPNQQMPGQPGQQPGQPQQAQPLPAQPIPLQPGTPGQPQVPGQAVPLAGQQPMPQQAFPQQAAAQPIPQQPFPQQAVPQQPVPQQPVPIQPHGAPQQPASPFPGGQPQQQAFPQPVQPLQPAPNQPIPQQPIPQQPIPQQPIPQQRVPNQPIPQQRAPNQPVPNQPVPLQPNQTRPLQPAPLNQAPASPIPQHMQPGQQAGGPQVLRPAAGQPRPLQPAQPQAKAATPGQPKTLPTQAKPLTTAPAADGSPQAGQAAAAGAGLGLAGITSAAIDSANKPAGNVRVYEHTNNGDEDEMDEKPPEAIKKAPPWLISLIVHAVGLVILGLLVIPLSLSNQVTIEVVYAETEGEQLIDEDLQSFEMETLDEVDPVLSEDLIAVEDPFAAPPDIPEISLEATSASSNVSAPSIGLALNGRDKGQKKALLGAYGGTATTEAAVLRGLEWLKRNQKTDGSWSLVGSYSGGAPQENRAAATAMALLAFQGAGHTHQKGEFRTTVAKGWNFLSKQMDPDGNFFHEGSHHARLYTQAQCTIAICELYGMTKDEKYRGPAQKALDYCAKAQSPLGGWRYEPRQDSDTSVTGWFVMALQSGKMAGLEVPSPAQDNIMKFLDSVSSDKVHYAYKIGQSPTVTMTAEALLCRQYLGWSQDEPALVQGVNYVNDNPIDYGDANVYYWYYATQLTHHMDGDYWDRWNNVMREVVPRQQVQTGAEKGSWNPEVDRWGTHGGRLFVTCLSIYMLEVYYRHLPIYSYRVAK